MIENSALEIIKKKEIVNTFHVIIFALV